MGFTFNQANTGGAAASATTVAVTLTGVPAGDVIIACWVKHEGAPTNVSVSDGSAYTNVLSGGTAAAAITNHSNGDLSAGWFYLFKPGFAGGNVTITATFAAARTF